MQQSKRLARGILVTLFFCMILFVLIPFYVERPAFIPGFAPPPDMWPRVISWGGLLCGVIDLLFWGIEGYKSDIKASAQDAQTPLIWFGNYKNNFFRMVTILVLFIVTVALIPFAGFLVSTIILAGSCLFLAGAWAYPKWSLALTLGLPLFLTYLFTWLVNTPFPAGKLFESFGL